MLYYDIIIYYAILCCTIIYYTALYYTTLHYTALRYLRREISAQDILKLLSAADSNLQVSLLTATTTTATTADYYC